MVECVAMGIDWSTRALSLGVDRGGLVPAWRTVEWPAGAKCEGARRLAGARAQIVPFLERVVETFGQPDVMVVEEPFGRVAPESAQMYGVVLESVAVVIECPIVELGPGTWKKMATGFGGHRKPKPKDLGRPVRFEDYGVAVWAREQGYSGRDWNECDGIGIARAASLLYARDLREAV